MYLQLSRLVLEVGYTYYDYALCYRSSTGSHKVASSIPLPGSALPARKCPPDKVRPVASSSRSSSPALSMIPRAPPSTVVSSPYQAAAQNKNSMLDKLKLFKNNNDKPVTTVTGKRTSSSSGVSSARSERSDSSASLEPNIDLKPARNNARIKQQKTTKLVPTKNSPSANKKELVNGIGKPSKVAADVEKHANKIANLPTSKLNELKVKVSSAKPDVGSNKIASQGPQGGLPTQQVPGTGIPKPTALVKGTSKAPVKTKLPPWSNNRQQFRERVPKAPSQPRKSRLCLR